MLIHIRRGWEIPERQATPEDIYVNRRKFLQGLGLTGMSTLSMLAGCERQAVSQSSADKPKLIGMPEPSATAKLYPAKRNEKYPLDRPQTDEALAARYNNFYEFSFNKQRVSKLVEPFKTRPWQIEVTGLVKKPQTFDIDKLVRKMALEERLYRHRCVEAWSMAVPWTGFPVKAFVDLAEPQASAKFMRLVTFNRPEEAVGMNDDSYPWPYFEGLTMAEATNELAFFVTGIYGHELTKQHGAPVRLVLPWKYGYKSIKSIVRIEFLDQQPPTFWSGLVPREYDFWANVNPDIPHPRWSQASERMLGSNDPIPTLLYNGYAEFVAHLYRT